MVKEFKKTFCLACSLGVFLLGACSSSSSRYALTLDQDAYVKEGKKDAVLYKKNTRFEVNAKDSTVIESPGYLGLILPPNDLLLSEMSVNLKPVSKWGNELVQNQTDALLSQLLEEAIEVQLLLSKKEGKKALTKVEELEKRYPKVGTLRFLKVSCLLLLGNRKEAEENLEAALKEFPESKVGKEFHKVFFKGQSGKERLPATKTGQGESP